jgi:uncharacterized membrane protein YuzA (DUF378 family)
LGSQPSAAAVLVIVGGLNWGLVALFEFDLVAWVFGLDFGQTNVATRLVYGVVGLSALVLAPPGRAPGRLPHDHDRARSMPRAVLAHGSEQESPEAALSS